ncbi:MAG TPA: cytidylate kinase-like family protein [Pyrinomonadaceae bacterium]|nr:cytidylate kinase-like family protein [Pyrinomonadaceae bacterium]
MRTTITISRQLGSGGSYVGQLIARKLNLKYVDREVLQLAAKEFGCDERTVAARAERVSSFWERILGGLTFGAPESHYAPPPLPNFSDRELFEKLGEIMKRIAGKHNCVVVGLAGVHVLPRHAGMFSIFCHAPTGFRVNRVMKLYKAGTKEDALMMIEESDEMRKKYFEAMTRREWACAENYHISVDTSLLPLDDTADVLIEIYKRKCADEIEGMKTEV